MSETISKSEQNKLAQVLGQVSKKDQDEKKNSNQENKYSNQENKYSDRGNKYSNQDNYKLVKAPLRQQQDYKIYKPVENNLATKLLSTLIDFTDGKCCAKDIKEKAINYVKKAPAGSIVRDIINNNQEGIRQVEEFQDYVSVGARRYAQLYNTPEALLDFKNSQLGSQLLKKVELSSSLKDKILKERKNCVNNSRYCRKARQRFEVYKKLENHLKWSKGVCALREKNDERQIDDTIKRLQSAVSAVFTGENPVKSVIVGKSVPEVWRAFKEGRTGLREGASFMVITPENAECEILEDLKQKYQTKNMPGNRIKVYGKLHVKDRFRNQLFRIIGGAEEKKKDSPFQDYNGALSTAIQEIARLESYIQSYSGTPAIADGQEIESNANVPSTFTLDKKAIGDQMKKVEEAVKAVNTLSNPKKDTENKENKDVAKKEADTKSSVPLIPDPFATPAAATGAGPKYKYVVADLKKTKDALIANMTNQVMPKVPNFQNKSTMIEKYSSDAVNILNHAAGIFCPPIVSTIRLLSSPMLEIVDDERVKQIKDSGQFGSEEPTTMQKFTEIGLGSLKIIVQGILYWFGVTGGIRAINGLFNPESANIAAGATPTTVANDGSVAGQTTAQQQDQTPTSESPATNDTANNFSQTEEQATETSQEQTPTETPTETPQEQDSQQEQQSSSAENNISGQSGATETVPDSPQFESMAGDGSQSTGNAQSFTSDAPSAISSSVSAKRRPRSQRYSNSKLRQEQKQGEYVGMGRSKKNKNSKQTRGGYYGGN